MDITEERAHEMVDNLNREFNINPCGLVIKPYLEYGKGAYYSYSTNNGFIYVSQKYLKEEVLIHEFAHHIVRQIIMTKKNIARCRREIRIRKKCLMDMNFGYAERMKSLNHISTRRQVRRRKVKKKRTKHHDNVFVKALKAVISVHYGDLNKYPTTSEYSTVIKKLGIGKV